MNRKPDSEINLVLDIGLTISHASPGQNSGAACPANTTVRGSLCVIIDDDPSVLMGFYFMGDVKMPSVLFGFASTLFKFNDVLISCFHLLKKQVTARNKP